MIKILGLAGLCISICLLVLSAWFGMLMNYLLVFLVVSACVTIVTFVVSIVKKQVHWNLRHVDSVRYYVLQGILRNISWIIMGCCVHVAVIPIQFSPEDFSSILITTWGSVAILCSLDWMPRKRTGKALNIVLSVFLFFLAYQLVMINAPSRSTNSVELKPAFEDDWYVIHGGGSALVNHHHFGGSQKYALDMLVPQDAILPFEQATELNQYRTFGKLLRSPIAGVVVAVENSLPDQKIGKTDGKNLAGNHVVVKTESDIYVLMAHLQNSSVSVLEGEKITIGQAIARIGNSGNTTQPHLHIQAMTSADYLSTNNKPVPIVFNVDAGRPKFVVRNDILPSSIGRTNK